MKDGLKGVVAQRTLGEIITAERSAVTGDMFAQASRNVAQLGADLIDVRIQRIDLPDDLRRVPRSQFTQLAPSGGIERSFGIGPEALRKLFQQSCLGKMINTIDAIHIACRNRD